MLERPEFGPSKSELEAELVLVDRSRELSEIRARELVHSISKETDSLKKVDMEAELRQVMASCYRNEMERKQIIQQLEQFGK